MVKKCCRIDKTIKNSSPPINVFIPHRPLSEEAEECLQDSEGRWMSFSAKKDTLLILEKKGLPSHIKLDNLEVAVTLQSLVCDLQDAGEATHLAIRNSNAKNVISIPP